MSANSGSEWHDLAKGTTHECWDRPQPQPHKAFTRDSNSSSHEQIDHPRPQAHHAAVVTDSCSTGSHDGLHHPRLPQHPALTADASSIHCGAEAQPDEERTPFSNTPDNHPIRQLFPLSISSTPHATSSSSWGKPRTQSSAAGGSPQSPGSPMPSPEPVFMTKSDTGLRKASRVHGVGGGEGQPAGNGRTSGVEGRERTSERAGVMYGREEAAARRIQAWWRDVLRKQDVDARPFCRYGKLAQHLVQKWVSGEWAPEPPFLSSSRLVLHLDINKTILMSDRVQDASTDHIVNMLLSECAWGRLEPGPRWMPVGRLATDRPSADPELMTYRVFLDSFLLPFRSGGGPDVERFNASVKVQRQKLKRIFTEEGQPGHMFRGLFQELQRALYLRDDEMTAANRFLSTSQLFATGERRLLPSFFHLLLHLQRQGQPFSLVFRTFGSDINEVVEEINLFATGQHPSFPGVRMDGSDGVTDIRLTPGSCGVMVRTSGRADGTILCWPAPSSLLAAKQHTLQQVQEEAKAGRAQLIQGMTQVYEHMKKITLQPGNKAIAIRDFYPYWKVQNERSGAGKLLLLEEDDHSCIQIFFDDNIGYGSAHIVDARDPYTAKRLPFLPLFNKHLVKAEPLNAILDSKYFIRMVSTCELEVLQERTMKRILDRVSKLEPRPSSRDNPEQRQSSYCGSEGKSNMPASIPPAIRIASWGAASSCSDGVTGLSGGSASRHSATQASLLRSTYHQPSTRSYIARTSMTARLRWDMATRKIRLIVRVLLYLKGH